MIELLEKIEVAQIVYALLSLCGLLVSTIAVLVVRYVRHLYRDFDRFSRVVLKEIRRTHVHSDLFADALKIPRSQMYEAEDRAGIPPCDPKELLG